MRWNKEYLRWQHWEVCRSVLLLVQVVYVTWCLLEVACSVMKLSILSGWLQYSFGLDTNTIHIYLLHTSLGRALATCCWRNFICSTITFNFPLVVACTNMSACWTCWASVTRSMGSWWRVTARGSTISPCAALAVVTAPRRVEPRTIGDSCHKLAYW